MADVEIVHMTIHLSEEEVLELTEFLEFALEKLGDNLPGVYDDDGLYDNLLVLDGYQVADEIMDKLRNNTALLREDYNHD